MKAEIIVKNGVAVILPEDPSDMDVFWQQIANRPDEAKPTARIACYNGYENAIEVALWLDGDN